MRGCGWCQGFWANGRGTERCCKGKEKKPYFPTFARQRKKKIYSVVSKTTPFWVFFLCMNNE